MIAHESLLWYVKKVFEVKKMIIDVLHELDIVGTSH